MDLRVTKADGLYPVDATNNRKFLGYGTAGLDLTVTPGGSASRGMELMDAAITGTLAPDGSSVSFRLAGTARAAAPGSATELVSGSAALSGGVSGEGWHVVLREKDGVKSYDLVAERGGDFPVAVDFVVPVARRGDWRLLDFKLPAGSRRSSENRRAWAMAFLSTAASPWFRSG